jgi:hypothetical protein
MYNRRAYLMTPHHRSYTPQALAVFCAGLLLAASPVFAADRDEHEHKKLAAYFEEWSIYSAGYDVANVQGSGAASKLTHLLYAFANVSSNGQCAIADTWADYQDPYLPSVNGQPYTGPLYGNFAALEQLKGLHPTLKVTISIGGASMTNTASSLSQPQPPPAGSNSPLHASTYSSRATSPQTSPPELCSTASTSTGNFQRPPIRQTSPRLWRNSAASWIRSARRATSIIC